MSVLDIAHRTFVGGLAVVSVIGLGWWRCAIHKMLAGAINRWLPASSASGFLGYGSVSFFVVRPIYLRTVAKQESSGDGAAIVANASAEVAGPQLK